jgi:hypothetical protein
MNRENEAVKLLIRADAATPERAGRKKGCGLEETVLFGRGTAGHDERPASARAMSRAVAG